MPWRMHNPPPSLPGWKQADEAKFQRLRGSLGLPSVLPTEQVVVVWPLMDEEEGFSPSLPPWAQGWSPGPVAVLSVLHRPFWSGIPGTLTRGLPYNQAECGGQDGRGRKPKHLHPPQSAPLSSSLPSRCRSFPSGSLRQCPFLWGPRRGDGWIPPLPLISQAAASVPLCL